MCSDTKHLTTLQTQLCDPLQSFPPVLDVHVWPIKYMPGFTVPELVYVGDQKIFWLSDSERN